MFESMSFKILAHDAAIAAIPALIEKNSGINTSVIAQQAFDIGMGLEERFAKIKIVDRDDIDPETGKERK